MNFFRTSCLPFTLGVFQLLSIANYAKLRAHSDWRLRILMRKISWRICVCITCEDSQFLDICLMFVYSMYNLAKRRFLKNKMTFATENLWKEKWTVIYHYNLNKSWEELDAWHISAAIEKKGFRTKWWIYIVRVTPTQFSSMESFSFLVLLSYMESAMTQTAYFRKIAVFCNLKVLSFNKSLDCSRGNNAKMRHEFLESVMF